MKISFLFFLSFIALTLEDDKEICETVLGKNRIMDSVIYPGDCTGLTSMFEDLSYHCCWVKYEVEVDKNTEKKITYCQRTKFTESGVGDAQKETKNNKGAKFVNIQCYGNYLYYSLLFLLMAFLYV